MRYRSLVAVVLWAAATVSAQTPVLTVTDVNYAAVDEGSPDVVLVIDGSGFVSGSVARLDANRLVTTLIGPTRITAVMPAALSVKPAVYQLSLVNPDGTSASYGNFLVGTPAPAPTSLIPNTVAAGSGSFTLTITGQNFLPQAEVFFNSLSQAIKPISISPTQIQATIPTSLVATAGVVQVRVANFDAYNNNNGSNSLNFYIGTPIPSTQPVISSFSPTSGYYLGPDFVLTVNGSNFDRNAQIRFAGHLVLTTYVSSTQLTTTILSSMPARCPLEFLSVANPAFESDNAVYLVKSAPAAVLQISPSTVSAPFTAFTLTVRGYGFSPGAVVMANGAPLQTTFVDPSQVTAVAPVSSLTANVPLNISVTTAGYATGYVPLAVTGPPITINGILSNASSLPSIAPGSLISIYGSGLSTTIGPALGPPLPIGLYGTTVTVNSRPIPLLYVSPTQINAQLPYEISPGTASMTVSTALSISSAANFQVSSAAPGIYLQGPTNRAVAVNLPDGTMNSPQFPASPGQYLTVYLTGQGAVNPPVASGSAAPADPLSRDVLGTQATIGGQPAPVEFAGLAPGFVGLLQMNVQVPQGLSGDQPLQVSVGGVLSNTAVISVKTP
jgi:uncharacterized protein (TIGR03437 family)